MLNAVLLSFFFGMPALVILVQSRKVQNPISRCVLRWGGAASVVIVALVILSMLGCGGNIRSGFNSCVGGDAITNLFNHLHPLMLTGTKAYILIGLPLAIAAYTLEWATRHRTA